MTVALVILDGWGIAPPGPGNALSRARLPTWASLADAPTSLLEASGEAVGLKKGQMGNSNVGHLNIGAGRVVLSDLARIDRAIRDGSFRQNPVVARALEAPRLHLLALFSNGGVHSVIDHLLAVLALRDEAGRKETTFLHLFPDGRDVPPQTALSDLGTLGPWVDRVATLCGRFYAMDRDRRWERTERAYRTIVDGQGPAFRTPEEAVRESYARKVTDEFLEPCRREGYGGARPGDVFFFLNFRADRTRQLSQALADPAFTAFARAGGPFLLLTMTRYREEDRDDRAAFLPQEIRDTLGEVVSRSGLTQWRVAETEKYAHVTYFLDGGREDAYPGEKRVLIPSPKVRTYDREPAMSSAAVTEAAVTAIREGADLLVVNYANPDMVGHTGNLQAAVEAVEAVDRGLGVILAALGEAGGTGLVIADHGNVETMIDPATGGPHTAHTTNPVPAKLVGRPEARLRDGVLADVAPTLLELLNLPQPSAMTGRSLIVPREGV